MISNKNEIDLSSLENENFQKDFAKIFYDIFIPQLKEFAVDYRKGIEQNDTEFLFSIVHKITSSLMFIKLNDFCDLVNEYKTLDQKSEAETAQLIADVESYCVMLKERLLEMDQ